MCLEFLTRDGSSTEKGDVRSYKQSMGSGRGGSKHDRRTRRKTPGAKANNPPEARALTIASSLLPQCLERGSKKLIQTQLTSDRQYFWRG